jgi:protein gp37
VLILTREYNSFIMKPIDSNKISPRPFNLPNFGRPIESINTSVDRTPKNKHGKTTPLSSNDSRRIKQTTWLLKDLKPHPQNITIYGSEFGNSEEDKALISSIKTRGFLTPITIKKDGTILSGHRRFAAARSLKIIQVPVIVINLIDSLEEIKIIVDSNRQRIKTNLQIAREIKSIHEVEAIRASQRQSKAGKGNVNLPEAGSANKKVGERFGMSEKQVYKTLKVLEAVSDLEEKGNTADAEDVLDRLNKSVHRAFNSPSVKEMASKDTDLPVEEINAVSGMITLSDWKSMTEEERKQRLSSVPPTKRKMNKQKTTSIEWAQYSWNPISGCLNLCTYCYARDIISKYAKYDFNPIFHPDRMNDPKNTVLPKEAETDVRYKNIFTCSMADLFGKWVPKEWIDEVMKVVRSQSQWNYLFLTKFPERLALQNWPKNAWVGASIDQQASVDRTVEAFELVKQNSNAGFTWLSLEPLLEPLKFQSLAMFDVIVIGGASPANGLPRWKPPHEWITDLMIQAHEDGCKVFLKDNAFYRPNDWPGKPPCEIKRAPDVFFTKKKKSISDRISIQPQKTKTDLPALKSPISELPSGVAGMSA